MIFVCMYVCVCVCVCLDVNSLLNDVAAGACIPRGVKHGTDQQFHVHVDALWQGARP